MRIVALVQLTADTVHCLWILRTGQFHVIVTIDCIMLRRHNQRSRVAVKGDGQVPGPRACAQSRARRIMPGAFDVGRPGGLGATLASHSPGVSRRESRSSVTGTSFANGLPSFRAVPTSVKYWMPLSAMLVSARVCRMLRKGLAARTPSLMACGSFSCVGGRPAPSRGRSASGGIGAGVSEKSWGRAACDGNSTAGLEGVSAEVGSTAAALGLKGLDDMRRGLLVPRRGRAGWKETWKCVPV